MLWALSEFLLKIIMPLPCFVNMLGISNKNSDNFLYGMKREYKICGFYVKIIPKRVIQIAVVQKFWIDIASTSDSLRIMK